MSNEHNNYLSLDGEEDRKTPLLSENSILNNDSTHLLEEENFISKLQTQKTKDLQDNKYNNHQKNSSSDEDSSHGEKDANIFEKQQNEAIKKLSWASVICTFIMIIEIIGGYLANSITIMSDAAHLLSDLLGFLISIISILISRKITKNNMSYGYHREEIIGVLASLILIWALTIWLLYEATLRIINTPKVDGLIMIIIAIIGFIFNVIMGIVLAKSGVKHNNDLQGNNNIHHEKNNEHNDSDEEISFLKDEEEQKKDTNVNLKESSFIHILGDALQNVGVFIAGGIIFLFPNFSIADPICTYIFTIIVILTTIKLLKDCIFVLMEGSPVDIDIEELEKDLNDIKGVKEIHDLHVWSLSMGKLSLSCHIYCDDPQKTLKKAEKMIQRKYKIDHINIQLQEKNNSNS